MGGALELQVIQTSARQYSSAVDELASKEKRQVDFESMGLTEYAMNKLRLLLFVLISAFVINIPTDSGCQRRGSRHIVPSKYSQEDWFGGEKMYFPFRMLTFFD